MAYPNTLIFVDFPSNDPEATARFYAEVFGWEVEGRPAGKFHRIVPGQEFLLDDGTPSGVGNLHMGIYEVGDARPNPRGYGDADLPSGRGPRVYVLVSDDDTQDRILDAAVGLGATLLWRDHYWGEFNGFCSAFRDPWGTEIILWEKGGDDPQIPENFTRS
jgi:catechol 2,3-dioxygenase-like lactoylglutathione lyase family enzyme